MQVIGFGLLALGAMIALTPNTPGDFIAGIIMVVVGGAIVVAPRMRAH